MNKTNFKNDILFESSIPFIDLSKELNRQIITDCEKNQYLGHPDTILTDDGVLLTFYPKGHGKGEIILKKSIDGGLTWSERLKTPKSWEDSKETPTVYIIERKNGTKRLELISGNPYDVGGFRTAYSEDNGETWSEFNHYFENEGFKTVVAFASLTRLKDSSGNFEDRWMGLFHIEKLKEEGEEKKLINYKTYLTFDEDGREQWTRPIRLLEEYDEIEEFSGLCEIEVIRSPKGNQLALIARAQTKRTNSMIAFSEDEGTTWTQPRELPRVLMGERHKAEYDNKSNRLLITFRDIIRDKNVHDNWLAGDWVAWVGTYDDLVHNREGQYRVMLMEDYTASAKSGDCGYAGTAVLQDGTFVLTSYGHWDKENTDDCYIMTVRLKLEELDTLYLSGLRD